jgi:hypothetical protein
MPRLADSPCTRIMGLRIVDAHAVGVEVCARKICTGVLVIEMSEIGGNAREREDEDCDDTD